MPRRSDIRDPISSIVDHDIRNPTLNTEGVGDITEMVAPALMLPMRLEYRIVMQGSTKKVMRPVAQLSDVERKKAKSSVGLTDISATEDKIFFRWYPDTAFSYYGIAEASADEIKALELFNQSIPTQKHWSDVADQTIADAWQTFSTSLGGDTARALYLKRVSGEINKDDSKKAYQVAAMPKRVTLFAVKDGQKTKLLSQKVKASDVKMGPADLKADGWMVDFAMARKLGMAAELEDQDLIETALNADWIIAVGTNNQANDETLNALINDLTANNEAEIMRQGTPTNNSSNGRVALSSSLKDISKRISESVHAENWSRNGVGEDASDAAVLANALGGDPTLFRQLPAGATEGHKNAQDMSHVILPALLETYFTGSEGFDLEDMVEYLAQYAYARGPLPAMRLGANPYGILPVLNDNADVDFITNDEKTSTIAELMHTVGKETIDTLSAVAEEQPVIKPDDSKATEKLESLLQQAAVSLRLDVSDLYADDLKSLGCNYVEASQYMPHDYMMQLGTAALEDMEKPSKNNRTMPLLYRLAYNSLAAFDLVELPMGGGTRPMPSISTSASSTEFDPRIRGGIGDRSLKFSSERGRIRSALKRLSSLSTHELEVLMMEVVDLISYRADALITATASYRLAQQRDAGNTDVHVAYYGMLGKLRSETTASSQGFVHAPSLQQATSAALIKSASLRNAEEKAFQIDLSSARTRQAIGLIDLLNQGFSIAEALGYRAERWLHDQKEDLMIYILRDAYPMDTNNDTASRPLIDGYTLQKDQGAKATTLTAAQKIVLGDLYALLTDYIDSLSDLVTAEAVHAMAIGDYSLGNAWTKVLSGGAMPSQLSFSSISRTGTGRSYRCSFLCNTAKVYAGETPRLVAEPSLAQFASNHLAKVSEMVVTCKVSTTIDAYAEFFPEKTYEIPMARTFDLSPLDIVIGGEAEIKRRITHHLHVRFVDEFPEIADKISEMAPDQPLSRTLASLLNINIDLAPYATLLDKASSLRSMLSGMRPLKPADIYIDLDHGTSLNDDDLLKQAQYSVSKLVERANILAQKLEASAVNLDDAVMRLSSTIRDGTLSDLEVKGFYKSMTEASYFAIPQALAVYHNGYFVDDTETGQPMLRDGVRSAAENISNKLYSKAETCREAVSAANAVTSTFEATEMAKNNLVKSIQDAVDGEALPILPPLMADAVAFAKCKEVKASSVQLKDWAKMRKKVSKLENALQHQMPIKLYRDVALSKSGFSPLYVVCNDLDIETLQDVAGGVVDEWSIAQKEASQTTGVAIHYDAPQSEAPNALLLAVASKNTQKKWHSSALADSVYEMIKLMKFRAIPANQASYVNAGIYLAPRIAKNEQGHKILPEALYRAVAVMSDSLLGLKTVQNISANMLTAHTLNERSRS